mmetsp:Transcript_50326/g.161761  ORF Transcript_50326/g.161761 Transcript_50326/m.161761 type:complete len:276 (+) Transcript_50326:876-1703(+)
MVPRRDEAAEDLGQEASVHGEQRTGHMVEDADGTHAERQVHHFLTLRSHDVVLGFVHRDVAGPEVVVALEAAGGVAHKLYHASAAADGAVRQQHRHAGLMLHVLHRLCEHGLRVRGATAVKGHDAVVVQRRLEANEARGDAYQGDADLLELPLVVVAALSADDVQALASPSSGGGLEGEGRHGAGFRDVGIDAGPLVHGTRDGVERELLEHRLTLGRFYDVVHENLKEAGFVGRHGRPVVVQVQVGNKHNRPSRRPSLAVQVHGAPVGLRARGDD